MVALQIAISSITLIGILILITVFLVNFIRYKFIGNRYLYLTFSFLLCLLLSIFVNLTNTYETILIPLGSSIFDALKMIVLSFDGKKLEMFEHKTFQDIFFLTSYLGASITTFFFLSLSVAITFFRSFFSSSRSFFRRCGNNAKIYYIFTDSQVTVSLKLAKELLQKKEGERGNAVTIYVSSASLKTQEGTEFRDMLAVNNIQVRGEAFSEKLAKKFVKKHFKENAKREVVIYCMFSSNDLATKLAGYFQSALLKNKVFIKLNKELEKQYSIFNKNWNYDEISFKEINKNVLDKFKIFVTYHETDIDLIYNFSKNTLHVINTLSQYDMISSEFMFDYPITKFVDFKEAVKKENIDSMNVTFFGLGAVNRPIFEKMTYAYQLWGDNVHKVHYHILDKNASSIVEALQNEYTSKSKDPLHPFLYDVDVGLDGKDLNESEIIDQFVKGIKDGKNRFQKDGFEMFVISFGNTNADLMASINLRNALVKYLSKEQLKKTYIFVRRSEGELSPERVAYESTNHIFDYGYDFKNEESVPIITYGGNALMPIYIKKHYNKIIESGIESEYAYAVCHAKEEVKPEELKELREKISYLWLDKDKLAVLKNTRVIYVLESKKELLALATPEQVKNMEKPETYEKYDESNPIIKIANLEHNRWAATNYLLLKATPMDLKTYLAGDPSKTKSNEEHVHACMVTNEGLQKLYDEVKDKKLAYSKFYQIDVKTAALMFENDIYK